MSDLPTMLMFGVEARLIPTVADSHKEERVSSILLAALMVVPCFCRSMLSTIGLRVGTKAKVRCFTEVTFAETPEGMGEKRPDGLIVVSTGRRTWTAIIEAKIDKNAIQEDQLKTYLALAKINGIDAVITVSNQMIAHPSHHPVKLGTRDRKGIELFHWSWMMIKTMALLGLDQEVFDNGEQRWILREVTRYLEHDSSGVLGFTQMNPEWTQVVSNFKSNVSMRPGSDEITNTIGAWHQEVRDLCLLMSRKLAHPVDGKLSKSHRRDSMQRLKDDSKSLATTGKLSCTLKIEGAADMEIVADLRSRTLTCSMSFKAPTDRQRHSARINWLIRQLSKTEDGTLMIQAHWPGRAEMTRATLQTLRDAGKPDPLIGPNTSLTPYAFDILMIRDLAGRFSRPKVFIEEVEKLVPETYAKIGQYVAPFQAPAPKVTNLKTATEEAEVQPRHGLHPEREDEKEEV